VSWGGDAGEDQRGNAVEDSAILPGAPNNQGLCDEQGPFSLLARGDIDSVAAVSTAVIGNALSSQLRASQPTLSLDPHQYGISCTG